MTILTITSGDVLAKLESPSSSEMFIIFFTTMRIPLYLGITFYSFLMYKELKSISLKETSGDFLMNDLHSNNYVPFSGVGHMAG
jgi:hypothetical protein